MAKRVFISHSRKSPYNKGFRSGLLGVFRGTTYAAAPVRVKKHVGSPGTDRAARYRDIDHVKGDVHRAKRIVFER